MAVTLLGSWQSPPASHALDATPRVMGYTPKTSCAALSGCSRAPCGVRISGQRARVHGGTGSLAGGSCRCDLAYVPLGTCTLPTRSQKP